MALQWRIQSRFQYLFAWFYIIICGATFVSKVSRRLWLDQGWKVFCLFLCEFNFTLQLVSFIRPSRRSYRLVEIVFCHIWIDPCFGLVNIASGYQSYYFLQPFEIYILYWNFETQNFYSRVAVCYLGTTISCVNLVVNHHYSVR